MSHEVTPIAYKTRLGNLPAKSVLALLADKVNDDGYGWPSLEYIADRTEINLRTVMRVVQVFEAIGLIVKVDRGPKRCFGMQLVMEKLGADLRVEFRSAYAAAQSKPGTAKLRCRRDSESPVSETLFDVAETVAGVAETFPPYPLIGGTAKEPPRNQTPPDPLASEGERSKRIDAALDQVRNGTGIVNRRVLKRLRLVIAGEEEKGEPPPTAALAMIAAWNRFNQLKQLMRYPYGPVKFFELGIWRNEDRWPWNEELLRERAQASVGSAR